MRAAPWLVGILLCTAPSVWAAPRTPSWRLKYSHPAGVDCPDASVLKQQVSRRLGYSPWNDDGPGSVDAAVVSARRGLWVRVKVVSPRGEALGRRDLRGQTHRCAELLDTAALTISIAIDPLAVEETQRAQETTPLPSVVTVAPEPTAEPEPPPLPPPPPPEAAPLPPLPEPEPPPPRAPAEKPVVTPEPPPTPRTEPHPQVAEETAAPPRAFALRLPRLTRPSWSVPDLPRLRLNVGLLTTLSTATAPHPVVGGGLHVDVRWGFVSLGLEARAELPGSVTRDQATVQSQLTSVGLVPCLQGGPLVACAVGVVGIRHVRAFGADFLETRQASIPFVALGPRVALHWPVHRHLALLLGVDLCAVPLLTRLKDARNTLLWSQPPITALAFAGATISPP